VKERKMGMEIWGQPPGGLEKAEELKKCRENRQVLWGHPEERGLSGREIK